MEKNKNHPKRNPLGPLENLLNIDHSPILKGALNASQELFNLSSRFLVPLSLLVAMQINQAAPAVAVLKKIPDNRLKNLVEIKRDYTKFERICNEVLKALKEKYKDDQYRLDMINEIRVNVSFDRDAKEEEHEFDTSTLQTGGHVYLVNILDRFYEELRSNPNFKDHDKAIPAILETFTLMFADRVNPKNGVITYGVLNIWLESHYKAWARSQGITPDNTMISEFRKIVSEMALDTFLILLDSAPNVNIKDFKDAIFSLEDSGYRLPPQIMERLENLKITSQVLARSQQILDIRKNPHPLSEDDKKQIRKLEKEIEEIVGGSIPPEGRSSGKPVWDKNHPSTGKSNPKLQVLKNPHAPLGGGIPKPQPNFTHSAYKHINLNYQTN